MNRLNEFIHEKVSRYPLLPSFLLLVSTFFLFSCVTIRLADVYENSRSVIGTSATMKDAIHEWKIRSAYLNNQPYRPVLEEQIPSVQADIRTILHQKNIEMIDYHAASPGASTSYRTFEMTCSGSYNAVSSFIENFHVRDALVQMESLSLANQQGKTLARITYRIYIK